MKTLRMVALTDDEIELLYDALDAVNDRYEQYKDDYEETLDLVNPAPEEVDEATKGRAKCIQDLALVASLNAEFQPLIKEIRRERERAKTSTRRANRREAFRARRGGEDR